MTKTVCETARQKFVSHRLGWLFAIASLCLFLKQAACARSDLRRPSIKAAMMTPSEPLSPAMAEDLTPPPEDNDALANPQEVFGAQLQKKVSKR